jgi:hypothetical protein
VGFPGGPGGSIGVSPIRPRSCSVASIAGKPIRPERPRASEPQFQLPRRSASPKVRRPLFLGKERPKFSGGRSLASIRKADKNCLIPMPRPIKVLLFISGAASVVSLVVGLCILRDADLYPTLWTVCVFTQIGANSFFLSLAIVTSMSRQRLLQAPAPDPQD